MESDVSLKCWNNNKKQGTTEQVFFTDDPASVFFINKCYHVFTRDCSAPLAMPHILKEKTEHIYEVQQPLCKAHAVQGIANMVCVCVCDDRSLTMALGMQVSLSNASVLCLQAICWWSP